MSDSKRMPAVKSASQNNVKGGLARFRSDYYYLAFLGIIVCAIGFLAENFARLISLGIIDSRFHILPFISPYGLVVFAFYLVFNDPDNISFFGISFFKDGTRHKKLYSNLTVYFIICLFVFLGELAIGNLWDALFGVELWNYESLPLNFTKYTCPLATFGYGSGAYLLFKFAYKPLLRLIKNRIPHKIAKTVSIILGSLIVLDTLRMIIMMMILGEAPVFWSVKLW